MHASQCTKAPRFPDRAIVRFPPGMLARVEAVLTDINWLCLFLPREAFPQLGPMIDAACHRPLDGGMGTLLGAYLHALGEGLPAMAEAELPMLVSATRAMVAACLAPSGQTREVAEAQLERTRMEAARRAIRRNLRSPTLTPQRLCRMVGMSRSQLYRLFEPHGGVAGYIQSERLREAHRALSDPGNGRGIREVAEDLGFFDHSTFSRAFRREFGRTPSEARLAALTGTGGAPIRAVPGPLGGADLAGILRGL